jgi:hypothetical protein
LVKLSALIFTLCILSFSACDFGDTIKGENLPSSSGKYGEVLVVMDTSFEKGPVGSKIREIFQSEVPATPQVEPLFRMSTVDSDYFKSILKRSRNLFKIDIDKQNQNKIKIDRDVWASDQLLINIYANSKEAALRILEKNQQSIRDSFNQEELDRLQKQYKKQPQTELMDEVKDQFGVGLIIPPAYTKASSDSSAIWFRKEKRIGEHPIIQGLLVYSQPYTSQRAFSDSSMIAHRNEVTKRFVEGARENSYMKVYDELPVYSEEINLNGLYAREYRALWYMENDFMGGPFLHITLVDEANQKVIHLDGFVYAPKFTKREYLRELEAIMKSLKLSS